MFAITHDGGEIEAELADDANSVTVLTDFSRRASLSGWFAPGLLCYNSDST